MKVVSTIRDLDHPVGVSTGFVPTMGAFHEGHLQLMRTARKENERVVVSLFVNPTQFGVGEDFERYPRDLERDMAMAADVGVDVLFAPSTEEIYPRESTSIHVPEVTKLWEGAFRPTHFAGVATIVCKLFNIVRCNVAYFGQKDLQQCLVISRMIDDLNIPVRFSQQPTTRHPDGLAMSSRNVYLSEDDRKLAPMLYERLCHCRDEINNAAGDSTQTELLLGNTRLSLQVAGFDVNYFELIDLGTAKPYLGNERSSALIVAARLGKTRLIDNVLMRSKI